MCNHCGCCEGEETLDVELVKLLGLIVSEPRKTRSVIAHRISPESWPFGRYHDNPPWPEMTQRMAETLELRRVQCSCDSCGFPLPKSVACPRNMCDGDPAIRGGSCLRLGPVTQTFGSGDLNQDGLVFNVLGEKILSVGIPFT